MTNELSRMQLVWGYEVIDTGWTSMPNYITRYGLKYLTKGEFAFIVVLCSFKHTSEDPFPKQETIAEYMGCKERQIRNYIEGLEEKGFLEVYYIYKNDKRVTAAYNFKGLLDVCLADWKKDHMQKDIENGVKMVKKVKPKKAKTKKSLPAEKLPEGAAEIMPTLPAENMPVGAAENLPDIIDKVNKQELINKENKQSIGNQDLDHLIKKIFDQKLTDRQIQSIHTVYDLFSDKITLHDYQRILFDIEPNLHAIKNFTGYLKKSIENYLHPTDHNSSKEAPAPIREEMVPDWINESKEERKAAAKPPMTEEEKKKIWDDLNKLNNQNK